MRRGYQRSLAQMALTLLRLFSEQVSFESLISAYFSCTRHPECFLGSGMGFHLWHVLEFGMAKVVENNNPAKYSSGKVQETEGIPQGAFSTIFLFLP